MNITELPPSLKERVANMSPTVPHYVIEIRAEDKSGIMDDIGGKRQFGNEWEMIRDGFHPDIWCEKLEITIN